MFDGIDASFGDGSFQIFDAVLAETHQLCDSCRGTHGYFLVAELRRQPHLHACGLQLAHAGVSVPSAHRHSANAVMSSLCGPPSAKSSIVVHNASRITSARSPGHLENSSISLSGPNSSSPRNTSVRPSV